MRVVIAGAGHAGRSVAAYLQRSGHDVTVIERDQETARRAFEQLGLVSLTGDATSARTLKEAGVAHADVVVAMLHRDADNLALALLAQAAGVPRVMVRMRDAEYRSVYVSAGIHRIPSETDVLIGALATAIEHDAVRHSMVLGSGEHVAFEIVVAQDARVAGQTVGALAADEGFPASCVLAGMSTGDGAIQAPRGSSVVEGGMALLLVVRRDDLGRAIEFFGRRAITRSP